MFRIKNKKTKIDNKLISFFNQTWAFDLFLIKLILNFDKRKSKALENSILYLYFSLTGWPDCVKFFQTSDCFLICVKLKEILDRNIQKSIRIRVRITKIIYQKCKRNEDFLLL